MQVALETYGATELPSSGPLLLVANHGSELDVDLVQECLPKDRRLRVANSAEQAEAELRRGRTVLYFPEQRISPDGCVGVFDAQLGALAEASGAQVVPIGIRGSYAAQPPGRSWVAPGRPRVSVRFGLPMTWRAPKRPDPEGGDQHAFAEQVRGAVLALIAEDETSWWQTVRRKQSLDPAGPVATWRRIWEQAEEPQSGGGSRRAGIWRI